MNPRHSAKLVVYMGIQYKEADLPKGHDPSQVESLSDYFKSHRGKGTSARTALEEPRWAEAAAQAQEAADAVSDSRESHGEATEDAGAAPLPDDYGQLKDLATEMGLEYPGNIKKVDLIDLIQKAR